MKYSLLHIANTEQALHPRAEGLLLTFKDVTLCSSVSFKYQAFHKTNDERRAYLSEIAKVSIPFHPCHQWCSLMTWTPNHSILNTATLKRSSCG